MAKCNICGAQLSNAPSWLDDVSVFACPKCKSDDSTAAAVIAAGKTEKKGSCPSCGGTAIAENDEHSLRCEDCGIEICRLCEGQLVTVDSGRECKGCGMIFASEADEDAADEHPLEVDDFDA